MNRVVAPGDELTVALGLADELAALPRTGVAATKRACNQSLIEEAEQQEWFGTW